MFRLIITLSALCSFAVFAQDCKPVDFGKGSVVCECNSTYCDYYPDPGTPGKGEFIWYVTSKAGKRLSRENGIISSEPVNGYKVTIDSNKQYQAMEGFGGAFTDSACINIKNLSLATQEHVLRSYFSTDGNKYNFGRVPIAGSDYSTRAYTYDDVSNDVQLRSFNLSYEDYDYKIPLLKKALQLNPSLRLVAASWTAPPWMKNRPTYNGFTYLQKQYYQTYAEYIVKFLEEYKKNGLEIWATSTGNEPFTSLLPMSHINSMYWSPENVAKWVLENLGPTLQKSNSNSTYILMLDDQRIHLPGYMDYIKLKNSAALNYVKGIAVHWYTDDFSPAGLLDITHKLFPDKFLLITEACTESFADWLEEKIDLPIFEELPVPECGQNRAVVYSGVTKSHHQPQHQQHRHQQQQHQQQQHGVGHHQVDATQTLLREFETVLGDVEACHQITPSVVISTLTPPQSPPPLSKQHLTQPPSTHLFVSLQPLHPIQAAFVYEQQHHEESVHSQQQQPHHATPYTVSALPISEPLEQQIADQWSSENLNLEPLVHGSDVARELVKVDEYVRSCAEDVAVASTSGSSSPPSPCTSSNASCISSEDSTDDPDWSFESNASSSSVGGRRASQSRAGRRSKPYSRTTVEDKRVRKKEQNKNAATRYRQKKKQEIKEILGEEQELANKNEKLQVQVKDLQREIGYLKGLMRDLFKAKGLIK